MKPSKNQKPIVSPGIFVLMAALIIGAAAYTRLRSLHTEPLRAFATPTPAATAAPTPRPQSYLVAPIRLSQDANPAPKTPPPAQVLGNSTINIVLLGLDSDTEREEAGRGWRSDTIAVLVVDVEKPACTVINVPRDTRARMQKLNSAGKVVSRQYNKINAAFQFGGGPEKKGHENVIAALEDLLFDGLRSEVNMGFYCSIDMDGIARFADAVEGVPITLEYDVPGFGKKGERIVLAGENARKFVRLRHGITGGSDIGRIGRQQVFIRAFAERVQEMGAAEAVPKLWASLSQYTRTNLNASQVIVLGDLLSRLDLNETEFITLPGRCKTIEGKSYYVPDREEIRELALRLWGG